MNERTTVYVPCEVIPLDVQLAPGSALSPMEEIALRAVYAGEDKGDGHDEDGGLEALCSLLGLNKRMALDLIWDLWRHEYVTLDFGNGQIKVTPDVAKHIEDGKLDQLPSAERKTEDRKVMMEKLTGHVLPDFGERRVPDLKLSVSAEFAGVSVQQAPAEDLEAAAARAVQDEHLRAGGVGVRQSRIVSVGLSMSKLESAGRDRWLPLEIEVGHDADPDGDVRVVVVDHRLPLARRHLAGRRLTRLVAENPDSDLARYLRGKVQPEIVEPPSLEEYLERIERRAAKSVQEPAGTRRRYHADLANEAHGLVEQLRWRVRSEVDARPVGGTDEHRAAVLEIIEAARTQIVLVCPRITFEGLRPLLPPLLAATARGVQVAVLWGGQGARLEERVNQALGDLRGSGNLQIIWKPRSCRTNAMLALADDRSALITGTEFMQRLPTSDTRQVGLFLRAPHADVPCEPIEHLLRWCGDTLPEYALGQALDVRFSDFRQDDEHRFVEDSTAGVTPPQYPPEPMDRSGDALADSAARKWGEAWVSWAAEMREMVEARTWPWAEVVEDSEHMTLLREAVRGAHHRLLIGSHRIGSDVVTPELADALRERSADGCNVLVAYQRSDGPGDPRRDPARMLRELSREAQEGTVTVSEGPTRMRLLIMDDEAVVSSFDFLSLDGYSVSTKRGRHVLRTEIGIRVVGAELADALCNTIGSGMLSRRPELTRTRQPTKTPAHPGGGLSSSLLAKLASADDLVAVPEILREALTAQYDPWPLLDDLHDAQPGPDVVRMAAARLLLRTDQCARPEWTRWLQWLIRERWDADSFIEAALLRSRLDDVGWRPRTPLAVVAAAHRTPFSSRAVDEALSDDLTQEEHAALVAVASADLLLGPVTRQDAVGEGLELLDGALDMLHDLSGRAEPWYRLGVLAQEHWNRTRMPLPVERVAADEDLAHRRDELDRAWESLADRLERAAKNKNGLGRNLGAKTHARLFHPDGALGRVRPIAGARDLPMLREWLSAWEHETMAGLVDQASSEVSRPGVIHPSQRVRYEERMTAIFAAARAVDRAADAFPAAQGRAWADDLRPMARALAEAWERLVEAGNRIAESEGRLVRRALTELETIARWGGA